MLKSPRIWLLALLLAVGIHLDWHLGRPGQHVALSFHLPYHWLLAIPVYGGLWLVVTRWWSASRLRAIGVIIGLGALLGQGLEPLGELVTSAGTYQPFSSEVRWRIFGEFMLAGAFTVASAIAVGRWRWR